MATEFDEGSPNTAITLTLPAGGPGSRVSISRLLAYRVSTLAVVASALLDITTTNMPQGLLWKVGNAISAFGRSVDLDLAFPVGLAAETPNTAVSITFPAAGLGVSWHAMAIYSYVGA